MITKRIFEQVRELIEEEAREKNPGDLLNTEVQYAAQFGVSRPTVRKAVDDLIRIGLIKRLPGKGLVINTRHDVRDRGKLLIILPHPFGDGFMYNIMMGCVEQANILGFEYKLYSENQWAAVLEKVKKEDLGAYTGIVTSFYEDDVSQQLMDLYMASNRPIMLVDNPPRKLLCPCITTNDYKGGYLMGQHLVSLGHERIINISGTRDTETITRRKKGFIDALHDANVDYNESLFLSGYVDEFLERFSADDFKSHKYTAICSHTSLALTDLSKFFYDNQLVIGEDVSLMGYGGNPYLYLTGIPLTSIDQPSTELGISAVDEISASLINNRPMRSVEHDVRLINRYTVKSLL